MNDSDIAVLHGELKQLNTKLDHLTELFNRAAHGDGFIRCARQDSRLGHVETSLELCHARVSGMKRWLWAGVVAMATALINYVWERVKSI